MRALKRLLGKFGQLILGPLRWTILRHRFGKLDKNSFYDKLTEIIIRKMAKKEAVFIDIGCHAGDILRVMMREAPDARFLAFEPLPFLYDELVRNFGYPNVKVFDLALSDSKGLITFNHVVTNPSYSGLRKRRYDRKDERDQAIEVKTDTLDHVLETEAIRDVTLIKLDVEGAEYLVLKGAKNTVLKHKPVIIFEHGMGGSDCYEKGPEDLYQLLVEESGLRISLLPDYLLCRMSLTAEEFSNQFHQGLNFYFVAHP